MGNIKSEANTSFMVKPAEILLCWGAWVPVGRRLKHVILYSRLYTCLAFEEKKKSWGSEIFQEGVGIGHIDDASPGRHSQGI